MRKMMIMVAALGIGWATQGCKKESPLPTSNELNAQTTKQVVQYKDGMLVFEDDNHLVETIAMLNEFSREQRESWESKIGFKSIQTMFFEVNDIENQRMEDFFKDVNPNLTVSEYEAMGLIYETSEQYKQLEQKGVLKTIIELDGSKSKELVISDGIALLLTDENQKIRVGEVILSFSQDGVEMLDLNNKPIPASFEEKSIYNFRRGIQSGGYNAWKNDPAQSNRRYRSWMDFSSWSSSGNPTWLVSILQWRAEAEWRRWGNWAIREGYKPIWGFTGTWDYEYKVLWAHGVIETIERGHTNSVYNQANSYHGHVLHDSPVNYSGGLNFVETNFVNRYFKPTISMHLNNFNFFKFHDPTRVFNSSFAAKFSGGTNGFTFAMIHP